MTSEPLAFFTVDRGTASTAAALVAPYGGRFRLLASGAVPASVAEEPLLEELVARVAAAQPSALGVPGSWRDWARLRSQTRAPRRILCAGATEGRVAEAERAALNAGWEVAGRLVASRLEPVAATEACLDRTLDAVLVAAAEPPTSDERGDLALLCALIGAAAGRRSDLACVLSGGAVEHNALFPAERVVSLPAPAAVPAAQSSPLRDALEQLPRAADSLPVPGTPVPVPDGRLSLRTAIASLAVLLDRRVEAVDVGHSAGARTAAGPDGITGSVVRADGALVPAAALGDERLVDGILRWSTLREDVLALRDRVRNLRLGPWRDASSADGARLRMAAARAALARVEAAWQPAPDGDDGAPPATDVLIATGGVFSVAPPPVVALALLDTVRRPGAIALFHDHARVLGPIGTLPDEADRRRLLADLLDDALLPLGSAILATDLRAGRHAGTLRLASRGRTTEVELVPGSVQLVDLPPGSPAVAELETREGAWLGVRARHVALDVTGGLGGLLLDTRDAPLRLPERAERRREVLEAWERPFWETARR